MTDLSPNAQKALDAFIKGYICNSYGQAYCSGLAAALRELANQLRLELPLGDTDADAGVFAAHQAIRSVILAIATELEGQ